MTEEVINPIHPEYIPRLTKEFIDLYNANAANRIASHQVPIEEVPSPSPSPSPSPFLIRIVLLFLFSSFQVKLKQR